LLQENLEEQDGAARLIQLTGHDATDIKNVITSVVRHEEFFKVQVDSQTQ